MRVRHNLMYMPMRMLGARCDMVTMRMLVIRYTPPHGQIDVAIRQTQTEILLEVSDTGPGIPEQERERVLERFYRGSHPGIEGSGLGLAIVSRIAEQHGAGLELLTGSTGHGLLVRIKFPSARAVQALHTNSHI